MSEGEKTCHWENPETFRCFCDGRRQRVSCAYVQTQYYDQFTRRAGLPGDRVYRFPVSESDPLFPPGAEGDGPRRAAAVLRTLGGLLTKAAEKARRT